MGKRQRMSFKDACDLVPDDMPDGAYWAMAHEMAELEYGEGFDELISTKGMNGPQKASSRVPEFKIPKRIIKQLLVNGYEIKQHDSYHFTARKNRKYVADWWPHKQQWRIDGKVVRGSEWEFQAMLVCRNH